MVKTCKAHLTDNGSTPVLHQPRDQVLVKIQDCFNLYKAYQDQFYKAKQRSEESGDKPFNFSATYIFNKFEGFSKRLDKVI